MKDPIETEKVEKVENSEPFNPFVEQNFEIRPRSILKKRRSRISPTVSFEIPEATVKKDTELKEISDLLNIRPYKSDTDKLIEAANGLKYAICVLAIAQVVTGLLTFSRSS